MRKSRPVALIGAGQLSRSFVTKLPGLPGQLGPVIAPSFRLASRLVNSIRAGHPAQKYEDLHGCRSVLIAVPEALLPEVVSRMAAAGMEWRRKVVLLCDSPLDSSELAPLAARGANTGSLTPMHGFAQRFVVEGHREAVKEARRLIHDPQARLFEIQRARKGLYLAALSFATGLFTPLADAALQCLRAAGLSRAAAESVAEDLFHKTLRAYLHAGRKAWSGPLAVQRELEALEDLERPLAQYYRACVAAAFQRFAAPRRSGRTPDSLH
ncbi:MAG: DUF2520 domain-containing protein [Acidobacteriota bacterium]